MNNFDPGTKQPDELKGDEAAAAPAEANEQATEGDGEKEG
jgi:hypothetical protein